MAQPVVGRFLVGFTMAFLARARLRGARRAFIADVHDSQ
jgi:hypothetical protein